MKKRFSYLMVFVPLIVGFIGQLKLIPELPGDSNTWFSSSGRCVLCHGTHDIALRDADGNDVSPVSQWRSTMLANASKDPFWLAKVKHEGLENPSHREGLENVCTRCHAPMGMVNAFMNASGNYTLTDLAADKIGKDGISCTVCHQIEDFHSPDFSGNFLINRNKYIYGPYPDPVVAQMLAVSGYTPVYNDQINNSRLCGSCHTLFTNSVFPDGRYTGEVFVEQALYHEWENSGFPGENIGCQTCHMPRIDQSIRITSRPLFLPGRNPFGQHTLTGGNHFMLNLLKENHDALGLHSGTAFLQMSMDRTLELLTNETLDLTIDGYLIKNDTVYVDVSLKNKAGHKFPTGFPSRRAYLEFLVVSGNDTLFFSGRKDAAALSQFSIYGFEPHHEVINREEQVQIYEFVMGDTDGNVTTLLERAHVPLKDNRLPPRGFSQGHQNYDTVKVVGKAVYDQDYFSGDGTDRIQYAIPASKFDPAALIKASLYYETVPESWLQQMFAYANMDEDINRFRTMYKATSGGPVMIASDSIAITTTGVPSPGNSQIQVYPNPSDGRLTIDGLVGESVYTVYGLDGRFWQKGLVSPWNNQLSMSLPFGQYLLVVYTKPRKFTTKIVVSL